MIVKLIVHNRLPITVVVNSASATGQTLAPTNSVQVVAELQPDADGVGRIELYVDPPR
jgi:hypothetical protein